ncbi:MAG: DPP IV N-terminal domain-containing protein [Blastocatellia bacterium]|nr:DPP IV N-terminal domain-containing protein [Blastocatellia bacterium]
MEERDNEIYEFGPFRLEVAERRLYRDGEPLVLPPKAFDVLVVLVRHDGKLLSKQELLDLIWPGLAVEEANLGNNISFLRKALGSTAAEGSIIETVPRHGYRFRGNVTLLQPPAVVIERYTVTEVVTEEIDLPFDTPSATPLIDLGPVPPPKQIESGSPVSLPQPPPPALARAKWPALLLIGMVSLLGLGFFAAKLTAPSNSPALPPPRIVPVTNLSGEKIHPAFSPDGKQLAYAWDQRETEDFDIYITQVGSLTPKRFTDNPLKEFRPVWSPDGKYLAFLRGQSETLELIIKSIETGTERSLGMVQGGLSWSPDGKYLAIQDLLPEKTQTGIFLLEVETGQRSLLTNPPAPWYDLRPVWSPDGRKMAFLRRQAEYGDIWVVPAQGGAPRQITFEKQLLDSLAWMADGKELVFSSNRAGDIALWRVSISGGEPQAVTPANGIPADVAVSPTGHRLVYHQMQFSTNLWSLKRANPNLPWSSANVGQPVPLTATSRWADSPNFSPDGNHIVFASNESGTGEIWTCKADGTNPVRLTFFNKNLAGTPHWSPDGQTIVFDGGTNGEKLVYRMSAQGGTPQLLTEHGIANNLPSWSRDGKWIYFCSQRTGKRQICKMPATGGPAVQVTKVGGFECSESVDQKRLYFTSDRSTPGIWELDFTTGQERLIPELAHAGRYRYWAVAAGGIFFAAPNASQIWIINFFDFKTRTIHEVTTIRGAVLRGPSGLAISPDFNQLVYAQKDQFGTDLVMVENFR